MLDTHHVIVIAGLVLGFGLVSRTLARGVITAPMVFAGAGLALAHGASWLGIGPLGGYDGIEAIIHTLGELTLIVLLFTDAARIDLSALRREGALPARLLGLGMPMTIVLGTLLAWPLFPELGVWELALLAAILAPTDAALGQAVVTSALVPPRIRQTLSVESGLNDGVAVPLVVLFATMAGAVHGAGGGAAGGGGGGDGGPMSAMASIAFTAQQVLLGPLAGIIVGFIGAKLVELSMRRQWMEHDFQELSGVALALLAALGAELIGGNGFIAAFVGGLTFGNTSKQVCTCLYDFAEAEGVLLMLLTFLFAGAALAPEALAHAGWSTYLYALLSLTVIRMVPVALSLVGVRRAHSTTLFLGWFGPRGLASVLFAILLLEELHVPHADTIVRIVMVTVLASIVLHGASAAPGARWYARRIERRACTTAQQPCTALCYRTRKGVAGVPGRPDPTDQPQR